MQQQKGDNIEISTTNQCKNLKKQNTGQNETRNYFISSGHQSGGVTHTCMSRRGERKKSCQVEGRRCAAAQRFLFFFLLLFLRAGEPKDVRRGRALAVMRIDCTSGGRGGSGARDSAAWLDLLSSAPLWQPIIRQRARGQIWEMSEEEEAKGEEGRR